MPPRFSLNTDLTLGVNALSDALTHKGEGTKFLATILVQQVMEM
jgi:hypothetical protein